MSAIESVGEGMTVFDASGTTVGTIVTVKMGDPEAVTAEGQRPERADGIAGAVLAVFDGGSGLPKERKERLLRLGYIEINGPGLDKHGYESADAIDRVTDEGVYLNDFAAGTKD